MEEAAADQIAAAKELAKMQQIEMEEENKKRREWKELFLKFLENNREKEAMSKQEQKEQEQIIEIVSEYEHRIRCLTKKRQKEIQDEMVQRKIAASKLVEVAQKSREEEEERILKKAEKEKEEKYACGMNTKLVLTYLL